MFVWIPFKCWLECSSMWPTLCENINFLISQNYSNKRNDKRIHSDEISYLCSTLKSLFFFSICFRMLAIYIWFKSFRYFYYYVSIGLNICIYYRFYFINSIYTCITDIFKVSRVSVHLFLYYFWLIWFTLEIDNKKKVKRKRERHNWFICKFSCGICISKTTTFS